MSTHIEAKAGDFAKVVLMPGDPNRAEWIAKTYLLDARQVNNVRGMKAYTGHLADGSMVSVMPSGMGTPSLSIYAQELFREYGVEVIIRVGTIGGYSPDVHLKDLVIAEGACSDSGGIGPYIGGYQANFSAIADFDLLASAAYNAHEMKKPYHVGNILSSTVFYNPNPDSWHNWAGMGVLGVEMEAYALYSIAAGLKKKALAICTVSDHFVYPEQLSQQERQESVNDMIEVALKVVQDHYKHTK